MLRVNFSASPAIKNRRCEFAQKIIIHVGQRLVKAMGGEICLERSELTSFRLSLPCDLS